MFFSINTYLSERSRLLNNLKTKMALLDALIIHPYNELSSPDFLSYLKKGYFQDTLDSIETSNFLITDSNDNLVYSNYPTDVTHNIIKKLTNNAKKRYLKEEGSYANFATTLSKEEQTYDYQIYLLKDYQFNGILHASASLYSFRAGMKKLIISTTVISLLVLLLSTAIFLYSTKTITKPIRLLNEAAGKVSKGDFDNKVTFISNDEMGMLADSFNIMTEKLSEYHEMQIDQIKKLNEELIQKNAELESSYEEVEATNEELETTNEELIATNEELEMANRDLFAMAQDLKKTKEDIEKNMEVVNSANEELRLLNKMKTSFLGMASHELKTPLVMIKGYAELILDTKSDGMDEPAKEMFTHILKGADTLNLIIRDMLDITKIEAKELKLHIMPVELKLVIDTVVSEMGEIADKRKQTITIEKLPKISILADAPQIHRVLVHLIANAIKFTPDNGKVEVYANITKDDILSSVYKEEGDVDYIDITVADSGIGIDKTDQDRIFDVFYEVGDIDHHRTSKTAYLGKGSGLGLTICKGIIEAHGGRIWVESEELNLKTFPGSRFHVVLPLKQKVVAVAERKEEAAPTPIPTTTTIPPLKKRKVAKLRPRVLIIEDEQDIIDLSVLILQDKYEIEIADNGADGIKKAFSFRPSLILLDIYMKGLNGYEVCAILKANERTKNIPIAMFTAGTQKYEIEKGYRVGVDDYITKPFNPKELIARIEKLINKTKKG
jgi:signal transduction histidine kinase/ActR/RegA family two-component response regulator